MSEVSIIAVIMVLIAVLGLVWDVASGLLTAGMDGILLLFVCLLIGGVFSLQLLLLLREKFRSRNGSSQHGT